MIGHNIIRFNHATMAAAIQHYLDTVLLKEAAKAKVIKVCELSSMVFEVTLTGEVAQT